MENLIKFEQCNEILGTTEKILSCLDTSETPGLDGMSYKFFERRSRSLITLL